MRFLKITILAVFIAFSAAWFFLSGQNSAVKKDLPATSSTDSFLQHSVTFKRADAENVKGDFERENSFQNGDVKAEMSRENGDFFVRFTNNEQISNYKIEAVVGTKKLQQYVAREEEKLILLPIAYDLTRRRWLNLNETLFEKDGADFFKNQADWQTACAACHLEKLDESQASFDVKNLDSAQILLACGSCHAKGLHESFPKSGEIVLREKYFDDIISAHRNAPRNADNFFADGSTKMAAHEYQGILRSVCFVQNKGGEVINCLSCHSPKNGKFDVETDEKLLSEKACTNCHQQFAAPEAVAEHTKHPLDSEAGNCYSCHLPEVAYGHLEFQRTHEISIPNPSLTVEKQVPNACNLCHADKSVNWVILQSKKLWAERFRDAEISRDKQFDQPEGIRVRSSNDAFLRALTADALKKHAAPDWFMPSTAKDFQEEDYPLVRYFEANFLRDFQ